MSSNDRLEEIYNRNAGEAMNALTENLDQQKGIVLQDTSPLQNSEQTGDSLNLNTLYRVKGHAGIFYLIALPNKSGIVPLREFLGAQTINVHKRQIECLGSFYFFKQDGSKITLQEVFNNMDAHTIEDMKAMDIEMLMQIMVPGYSGMHFKPYHALKVIKWYSEIKVKIQMAS